jgi:hypothetical protein
MKSLSVPGCFLAAIGRVFLLARGVASGASQGGFVTRGLEGIDLRIYVCEPVILVIFTVQFLINVPFGENSGLD